MEPNLCWRLQSLGDVPVTDEWLSEEERRILKTLRYPKRRQDWRLGRWTAKCAARTLCNGIGRTISMLDIRAAKDGAPEMFLEGAPVAAAVSISHSGDCGFCVASEGPVALGCDIEQCQVRDENLIRDFFTPEEAAFCLTVLGMERTLRSNFIWSAKESVLKALREGLRRDTRSVAVTTVDGMGYRGWKQWRGRCLDSDRIFHGWWRASDGYIMTMASDHPDGVPHSADE